MKKTRLVSNTKLQSKSRLKSNTKLKSNGKKIKSKAVDAWAKLRTQIFIELAEQNINSCELRYENCAGSMFGSLAHSKKRRDIKTDDEMREVIWCCCPCHMQIEALPKEQMFVIVTETIKNRGNQSSQL